MANSPFATGLDKNAANYAALTPLSFLERAAWVYPDYPAVIHGSIERTWRETYARCRQFASALSKRGIGHHDTVTVMTPNTPAIYEAHFAVPMVGAVLNALNTRLDPATIAYILDHGEAKVLITDTEFAPVIEEALSLCKNKPLIIDADDSEGPGGKRLGEIELEDFIAEGDPDFAWVPPADEWESLSLNYTSGTTGNPKGVVYHHRGAYLNAMGNIVTWGLPNHARYLWTLPMFHCNGWCFPWTMAAIAGVSVCLRKVDAPSMFNAFADRGVTHLCGAPIVMGMLVNAGASEKREFDQTVQMMTAAAPPPASVIQAMENLGIKVTHVYGLTEIYGPGVVCAWKDEWTKLPVEEQARIKSRQGVKYVVQEDLAVLNPETLEPVPADGQTMGEVMTRGNVVMKGYLKNPKATEEAFAGGWFHTGDLGVMHPDGYVELKDRSKDIIISGGENISTIEIEDTLYRHPAVAEAAVVARPDEKWGETPCAFVSLRLGKEASEADLIAFCRENMAHFKCPRKIVFEELPKTSTGKVQKFVLRERAKAL